MQVKEIMIKKVKSLKPEDSAHEALNTLFSMRISGLPVIDDNGKLAGMFTEKEIIAKIMPSYLNSVGVFVYDPKVIKQKISAFSGIKVKDVMRTEVATVNEDAHYVEATRIMLIRKARRIIVLDKDENVVGIITREDILKFLFSEVILGS